MWRSHLDKSKVFALAASVVSICGCDIAAAPSPPQRAADATQVAEPPGARYRVDPARKRLWVLSRDGLFLYDHQHPEGVMGEVKLPGWQAVDPQYSCLPDLALGPRGEAVVTSNIVTLWKIDPDTLAVSSHVMDVSCMAPRTQVREGN